MNLKELNMLERTDLRPCDHLFEHQKEELIDLAKDGLRLRAENKRLKKELLPHLVVHEHECRYWRMGKSHGPCTCDAEGEAQKWLAKIVAGEERND